MCLHSFNLASREAANHGEKSPDFLTAFSPSLSHYCTAYGVCFHLQKKCKPSTAIKVKQAVIFFFLVLYFPFPHLTVTEGTGRINHKRLFFGQNEIQLGKAGGFSFIFLFVFQPAQKWFLKFLLSIWHERKSPWVWAVWVFYYFLLNIFITFF